MSTLGACSTLIGLSEPEATGDASEAGASADGTAPTGDGELPGAQADADPYDASGNVDPSFGGGGYFTSPQIAAIVKTTTGMAWVQQSSILLHITDEDFVDTVSPAPYIGSVVFHDAFADSIGYLHGAHDYFAVGGHCVPPSASECFWMHSQADDKSSPFDFSSVKDVETDIVPGVVVLPSNLTPAGVASNGTNAFNLTMTGNSSDDPFQHPAGDSRAAMAAAAIPASTFEGGAPEAFVTASVEIGAASGNFTATFLSRTSGDPVSHDIKYPTAIAGVGFLPIYHGVQALEVVALGTDGSFFFHQPGDANPGVAALKVDRVLSFDGVVAVTSDENRIYVGGCALDPNTQQHRPWLAALLAGTGSQVPKLDTKSWENGELLVPTSPTFSDPCVKSIVVDGKGRLVVLLSSLNLHSTQAVRLKALD